MSIPIQDRMSTLQACEHALGHNLGLTAGESVLVVTDSVMQPLGEAFGEAARALRAVVDVDLIVHVDGVLTRPRVLLDGEELSLEGREPE